MNDTAIPLTREQQATLNNLRAVIKRQLRPTSSVDPVLVADMLLQNSDMMREAGLAQEHLDYLDQMRDRTAEGSLLYARLTSHMAAMMDAIDDLRATAEDIHKAALAVFETLGSEHPQAYAEALIAYGRHLISVSHLNEATAQYTAALAMLDKETDAAMAAVAEGELGRAYVARGLFEDAVGHFKAALARLPTADALADEHARIQADYATALIQLGQMDEAEKLLNEALATCDRLGLWALRGQIRRELAYIEQMRAEAAQDEAVINAYLDKAENMLQETIADLLPISETLGLAVAYHDLGRLEARRRNFPDASYHVNMSRDMFERLGNRRNLAVALITLGQIVLLKDGDVSHSNEYIHRALALASDLGDRHTQQKAAESLVRIHKLQTRRAVSEAPAKRHQVIDQITYSRARLKEVGLVEFAEALDPLIAQLEGMEKSGDDVPTT